MAEAYIKKLLLDPNHAFTMELSDFVKLFPKHLRSHAEVKFLHKAIQDKKSQSFKQVKNNIKEAVRLKRTTDSKSDAEFVLEMLEILDSNLSKEINLLDSEFSAEQATLQQWIQSLNEYLDQVEEYTAVSPSDSFKKDGSSDAKLNHLHQLLAGVDEIVSEVDRNEEVVPAV